MIPGADGNFWSTFFPAVLTLGFGMAISVAPLTTTVMGSVPENRVGIASGINNAVSRAAALVAIAVLGIVMLYEFNQTLDRHMSETPLPADAQHAVAESRSKLAGTRLPKKMEPATRAKLTKMINDSFVAAFRGVMLVGAALALASSVSALLLISGKTRRAQG